MRILELLEGKQFKDLDFIRKEGDKTEINFDLAEDLKYFLNTDDNIYRRHVYPVVHKCISSIKKKQDFNPSIFKPAVIEAYKEYVKQFPLKELSDTLDSKVCEQVCDSMYEEICKDYADGKYKD